MVKKGFVLIELIVVLAMIGSLIGLTVINVFGARSKADLAAITDTLVSDLSTQQSKAMSAVVNELSVASSFGIHFEQSRYILFRGSAYNQSDTSNSVIPLAQGVEFANILFPSGNVIYASRSGEIVGFTSGADRVTLRLLNNTETKTIQLNRYGVITSIN